MVKNLPDNAGQMSSIPGLGRSSGEGNGNPLQYPCLRDSMDRGAWQKYWSGLPFLPPGDLPNPGIKSASLVPLALAGRFPSISAGKELLLRAMQETPVRFLGWKDLLEKGMATHSSILAWRIPWTIQSMGPQRVRHN